MTDADDPVEERMDHATPAGGTYSIAHFYDEHGTPTPKSRATRVTITEHAPDGVVLATTSGRLQPQADA